MSLRDSPPSGQSSREDILAILIAVTRAYGMQEASGKASRVIVDSYDIESAREVMRRGNIQVYQIGPEVATSLDRPQQLSLDRWVIEVTE